MARLVTSGFELQTPTGTSGLTSGPDGGSAGTAETGIVRSGSASRKCVGTLGGQASTFTIAAITLGNDCFVRCYFYVATGNLPTGAGIIEQIQTSVSVQLFAIQMNTDGTLNLISGASTVQGSASAAIALDAWNMVDLRGRIDTGALDQCEGRLNGVSFASASGLSISDTQIAQVTCGYLASPSQTVTLYTDDVAVNDSSGASQSSWPGEGKIVVLRPTADSTVGTGWTLGNTTATGGNAWQRLDNAPPDSATDLTTAADADQIRNATSNANVNYDATMTTYTAAGVTGTVNVVVPIIATGAPVTTSAKQGTVGVASNPTIANISLGAGGTSGAFWSGVAMGTYPTGNKWSFGTTTYAPTVTLGTAPVMRVTQVTASTRIAIVTEMGIYVDYTPVSGTTYTKAGHAVESG